MNSVFYNSSSKSDAGCISANIVIQLYFKNVSIEKSSTFDKGGTAYFINIQNILFDNIIINNSSASSGGMFYFDEKTNVIIINSEFKSGHSLVSGGFAFIKGDDMNITIILSSFFEFLSGQYAAIIYSYNILNMTIIYSNFSSSLTQNSGLGIIYFDGFSEDEAKFFNFYDVYFFNNSALKGANLYYDSNSKLNLTNCRSFFNQGSLLSFESDSFGAVFIQSSLFSFSNYLSTNLNQNSLIILSQCLIFINNIQLINNNGTQHLFEIIKGANLILENSVIINYSSAQTGSVTLNSRVFYVLNSKLSMNNCRADYTSNMDLPFRCIYFEIKKSIFISINDSFQNVCSNEPTSFFKSFESHIELNNISISISDFLDSVFHVQKSNFSLYKILFKFESMINIMRMSFLFIIDGFDSSHKENLVKIANCFFLNSSFNLILITNINYFIIDTCIFKAYNDGQNSLFTRAIELRNVNFLLINGSKFQNFLNDRGSCISIISTLNTIIFVNIKNTVFFENTAYFSSVVYIRGNISLSIDESFFTENKAITSDYSVKDSGKGGCMIIDCEYYKECFASLRNVEFENNYASIMGPTILSKSLYNITFVNITFKNNYDKINFTTTFSCFPILNYILSQNMRKETRENFDHLFSENSIRTTRLISENELIGNLTVASGQNFSFYVLITDALNQQIISSVNLKFSLTCVPIFIFQDNIRLMINKGVVYSNNGFVIFEKVSITFKPFSYLKCQINYQYPQDLLFESTNPSNIKLDRVVNINMSIFVRDCAPGELYQLDETCFLCPFGTYALHVPNKMDLSKECIMCPKNAYCPGGKYLSPLIGYWRINNKSNLIQKCLNNEACLGVGDNIENIRKYNLFSNMTELQRTQGICGKEYEGNLCFYCRKGLARFKYNGPCQECDCLMIIYFKMAMSFIFIVFYVGTQAKIFGKIEKEDPHLALLTKMIVNHFQTMAMIDLIDLGWTYDFDFYFSIKNYFSFLSEDFFLMDCLIQKIYGNLLVNKIIFTILLPLFLSIFMFLFWVLTFYFSFFKTGSMKKRAYNFLAEKMRITFLIFMFIFYPEMLKKGFSLLNCIIIDEVTNFKVLARSPDIECWTSQHTFWVLTISLPGIIFWGILAPLFISLILKIYCKNFNQILHLKEYNSFMKILESEKNKKFIVLKTIIINIEKELAKKLFTIKMPNFNIDIGYITKRQTFFVSKKIKIVEKEEIEEKLNLPQKKNLIKIEIPANKKKQIQLREEILNYQNTKRIVKDPAQLLNILEIGSNEDLKLTYDNLNLNKVLVQEEFSIEYDYKKRMTANNMIPSKMSDLQLKIPTQARIIIRNFGFIYKGYRKEYFFWELVLFSRKFSFIFIGKQKFIFF